jgi:hypothetical protein
MGVFRTKIEDGPRLVLNSDDHIGLGYKNTSASLHDDRILLEIGNTTKGGSSSTSDEEIRMIADKLTFGPWTKNIQADGTWGKENGYK